MTTALAILFGIAFLELVILLDLQQDVVRIRDVSREALRMLSSGASDASGPRTHRPMPERSSGRPLASSASDASSIVRASMGPHASRSIHSWCDQA